VSRTLFISVSPGEIWAALEEGGVLEAFRLVRVGAQSRLGEIFLGRVVALRPELPAALIEIGLDRPGFLDARDADPRRGLAGLTEGEALIVEVVKEARADKAPGLRLLRGNDPRRGAMEAAARAAHAPARLDAPRPPIASLLAAFLETPPDRIVIDERNGYAQARAFLRQQQPDLSDRLQLYMEPAPLFEEAGLAAAIDAVLRPRVDLAGGAALHIEPTHAATLIDVDSGKAQALAANLGAAREAARQIRLRNLAGPIVIDFVGMKRPADRDRVLATLKEALADDPEQPEILGWTRLGHVELVRRRREAPLAEILFERAPDVPLRKTALTIALEALRAAEREARAQPGKALILAAHPDVIAALESGEGRAAREGLEARLGRPLGLAASPHHAREAFDIRAE
jgi:Ribonuclease G/E